MYPLKPLNPLNPWLLTPHGGSAPAVWALRFLVGQPIAGNEGCADATDDQQPPATGNAGPLIWSLHHRALLHDEATDARFGTDMLHRYRISRCVGNCRRWQFR